MRKLSLQRPALSNRRGQAILEYVLMMLIVVALVAILSKGLKSSLLIIWEFMAQRISAACPGCPPPPNVKF